MIERVLYKGVDRMEFLLVLKRTWKSKLTLQTRVMTVPAPNVGTVI